jgi:hypothetical protein
LGASRQPPIRDDVAGRAADHRRRRRAGAAAIRSRQAIRPDMPSRAAATAKFMVEAGGHACRLATPTNRRSWSGFIVHGHGEPF